MARSANAARVCAVGHPLLPVAVEDRLHSGVKLMCLECIRAARAGRATPASDPNDEGDGAVVTTAVRLERYTVADLTLALECQEEGLPAAARQVPQRQSAAVDRITRQVDDDLGVCTAESLRRAVRDWARRSGEPVSRLMGRTPDELCRLLGKFICVPA